MLVRVVLLEKMRSSHKKLYRKEKITWQYLKEESLTLVQRKEELTTKLL